MSENYDELQDRIDTLEGMIGDLRQELVELRSKEIARLQVDVNSMLDARRRMRALWGTILAAAGGASIGRIIDKLTGGQ